MGVRHEALPRRAVGAEGGKQLGGVAVQAVDRVDGDREIVRGAQVRTRGADTVTGGGG